MTQHEAESLLATYITPSSTRGGLCMLGVRRLTKLDYNAPWNVSGSIIDFTAYYAELDKVSTKGNFMAGTGQVSLTFKALHGKFTIDTRKLTEIRVLETNQQLQGRCPNFKSGYVVVLKTEIKLPDSSEVSINAINQKDLDSMLATLSFLSPQAKLVSGTGM